MSLPFYQIECTNCSYKDSYSYNVSYIFDGGREAVCQPELPDGWCHNCEKVLRIYSPKTEEMVKNELERLSMYISEEKEKRNERNLFLFKKKVDEELIEYFTQSINDTKNCVKFFQEKKFPMRCLSCGSTNVSIIDLPTEYSVFTEIGINHHCGGKLLAEKAGRIGFVNNPKVIYNIQGNILSDER